MRSEIFCKWNFSFFKAVPPNRMLFYMSSLLHIISSLPSHFRSWDYPENFGIYSQLDRKSKTWFFTFLSVYVCWIEQDKIQISQLSPPKFRYFVDQNRRTKVGSHENEFWQFSNTKMDITTSSKSRWKNGVIWPISCFPSWVMVLKLPKIAHFFQIWSEFNKKPKSIEAIYFYLSERPDHALWENSIFL